MDWITTANGLIALITAFAGLVGTGISLFFLIKNLIKSRKDEKSSDNWKFIMECARAAMSKAEESGKKGKAKKEMVIDAVKEACLTAGIDIGPFLDQLFAFIDQSIAFANTIK